MKAIKKEYFYMKIFLKTKRNTFIAVIKERHCLKSTKVKVLVEISKLDAQARWWEGCRKIEGSPNEFPA